jgi:hypothetical protein
MQAFMDFSSRTKGLELNDNKTLCFSNHINLD